MGINEARVAELIDKMDMASCLGPLALDFELQEGGANLSGGQQQRLALIRAMQVDRPILILDEATSALDVPMRDVVFGLLRERARTGTMVILVTHDPELAQQCDHVVRLELVGPDAP
jgi:ABC-type bacteriocin/lantibiotic exporter with double-glycine peptidase domain